MARSAVTPSPDPAARPLPPRRQPRRFWPHLMLFAASVLLVNGLFGERGLTDTIRARRAYRTAIPHGLPPTAIRASVAPLATSTIDTSPDGPFAV